MGQDTKIEWCDHSWNPWVGCTKVGPGCDHCYAEAMMDKRLAVVQWGGQPKRTTPENWNLPLRWERRHADFMAQHGRRQRVFAASLADVFDNRAPAAWRLDMWELIRTTPHLDWLLLTKRVGNVPAMLPADWGAGYPNVWLGITVVNQAEADRDVPKLLDLQARVRFVSAEPLLAPLDLTRLDMGDKDGVTVLVDALSGTALTARRQDGQLVDLAECFKAPRLHWVIAGGESRPGARPMQPAWAMALRDQCAGAGVPFLFKQWGEWLGAKQDGAFDHQPMELNASDDPIRVGKKAAGRLLDGRTHDGFPVQPQPTEVTQ